MRFGADLPQSDADTSPIISVIAMIEMTDTSPSAVVEALSERWGPPGEQEIPVAKVRYFFAMMSIDSISKLVIASEERRKKALEATRP